MTTPWRPLAEALIVALEPALPAGFDAWLDTEVGGMALSGPDAAHAEMVVGVRAIVEQPGDDRSLLRTACWSVLSGTQDLVARTTGEPWPGDATELPLPDVEVEDAEIRLWYGRREDPALDIGPIHSHHTPNHA